MDFVNVSYLVVHPRGTVMFDTGGIGDEHFPADGGPAKEGIMTARTKLVPQLASAGYKPSDITHLVMSHYHSDHTGNANLFAGATWIVQKAERDVMFGDKPVPILQPATYSALRNAKTTILDNEDLDVFGDGTVVVKTTPGHTPGHQVLFVKLAKFGPVILLGRPLSLPGGDRDRQDADVRVRPGDVGQEPRRGAGLREADRREAVDRTRQAHARRPAESAEVSGVVCRSGRSGGSGRPGGEAS